MVTGTSTGKYGIPMNIRCSVLTVLLCFLIRCLRRISSSSPADRFVVFVGDSCCFVVFSFSANDIDMHLSNDCVVLTCLCQFRVKNGAYKSLAIVDAPQAVPQIGMWNRLRTLVRRLTVQVSFKNENK